MVWILVATYVALGTALFYGLAVESTTVFLTAAGLLALLAVPQWLLLSGRKRRHGRSTDPERLPRNQS
ncbi:hypothetical protein [Natrinema amylolyticum]|uniref:hypothetical protein n=1 Tax=Natrinema amylolyticum TaxID=2878679 RepID=UPI001CFB6226|nr:hypothetical protein [Natrinema amylolyticum]